MSGTISRSTSLQSPEEGGGMASAVQVGGPRGDIRGPGPSPLQHFVQAKKKINEIFREVDDYVKETEEFLVSIPEETEVISQSVQDAAKEFELKVAGIREVLSRDHMKVAFFGRTSNGKSTAINSLLGDKILPTGIGHTTSCFLQVEGSHTGEAYLTTESSDEHRELASLSTLGSALCAEKLDPMCRVQVFFNVDILYSDV